MIKAQSRKLQEGVMLLEALVAILIFTLGIIALMGLQAASISQVSQAKYRTDASYLANQIVGRMWVDQASLATYATAGSAGRVDWDGAVAKTLPSGTADIVIDGRQVTVTINWKQPDDIVARKFVTVSNINGRS